MKRYFISYAVFLCLLSAALFCWNYFVPGKSIGLLSWGILAFLSVTYFISHVFIQSSDGKKPGVFVRRFMGSTTLRLFVFLIVLVIYVFAHRHAAVPFVLHFLVFYFLFTVFEVASLQQHFRKNS